MTEQSRDSTQSATFSELAAKRREQVDRDLKALVAEPIRFSFDPSGTHLFSMIELARSYCRRSIELADVIEDLLTKNYIVSAAISARALVETTAMGCLYIHDMRRLVAAGDRELLEARFNKFYLGSKGRSIEAIHVLDAIRHLEKINRKYVDYLDKKYGALTNTLETLKKQSDKEDSRTLRDLLSVEKNYDMLSEIAHPNGTGTHYLFPESMCDDEGVVKAKRFFRSSAIASTWHRFHLLNAMIESASFPEEFRRAFL